MKEHKKGLIIWGIILFILIVLLIFRFIFSITVFNSDDANGNFSGNLLNNATFCEHEGKIYFANPDDHQYLYTMNPDGSDKKLLAKDSVQYLNIHGSYIFYTRTESQEGSFMPFLSTNRYCLCRINTDGSGRKVLDGDPSMAATLVGNFIYYVHYDKETASTFWRVKIDGSGKEQVSPNPYIPSGVDGSTLFYTEIKDNHNIIAYDTLTSTAKTIHTGNCGQVINKGSYLYFMDLANGYSITRVNVIDGKKEVLVNRRSDCYNITDTHVYYQTVGDNPAICRRPIDGGNEEVLMNGSFNEINVTSEYVYFKEFKGSKVYKTPAKGDIDVTEFGA